MNKIAYRFLLFLIVFACLQLQAAPHPGWFKNTFLNLQEDLEEASESNKGLLLYFYQEGCPYCERMIGINFTDRNIAEKVQKKYDVIAINMWGDSDIVNLNGGEMTEKELSVQLKVQYTPTMLFINSKGETLFRLNGYYEPHRFNALLDYLETSPESSFRDYYSRIYKPQKSSTLNQQTFFMVKGSSLKRNMGDRPLMVLFEQRDCADCDEMHNRTFQQQDGKSLMAKMDIAQFDIWDIDRVITPDGTEKQIRKWVNELNIQYTPALVFFNGQGQEIFRSESYIRSFHTLAVLKFIANGVYLREPEFQRYIRELALENRSEGRTSAVW